MSRLDVIIFGASGFAGKNVVVRAVELLENMKWGVAGRNEDRLKETLKEAGDKLNKNLSDIPIIIADVYEEDSLAKMAEAARIIVNCSGPYRFFGEPVVKACINAGTHHVDLSGEPEFIERMQFQYNDLAEEKGVYVVSACGIDSIPADLGALHFERHFDGDVHAIDSYLKLWTEKDTPGASIHYGTWESAVYGLAHAKDLIDLRKKLFKEPLPFNPPKQKSHPALHKSKVTNGWCVPFFGSDKSVVLRSQRYLYEKEKKKPVQYQAYIEFPSFFYAAIVVVLGTIFGFLAKYSFGRKLLLNYPKLFSFGTVSGEGPTEEKMENTNYSLTFSGYGWPKEEKLAEPTDQHTTKPSKKLVTKVLCKNPGYGATSVSILLSAVTILNEGDKLPANGGVIAPGACFAKTNLISRLCDNGFKFEVLSSNEDTQVQHED